MQENEENFQEQQETLQKQLDETNNELTQLKRMITSMVKSLVGKHYTFEFQPKLTKQARFLKFHCYAFPYTGPRDGNLRKTAAENIKCMYTLTRQLYFGSCEVIKAARLWENPPSKYTEVLGHCQQCHNGSICSRDQLAGPG